MKEKMWKGLLLASLMIFGSCQKEQIPTYEDFEDSYVDTIPTNSEDGVTFHAFCWTFNQIKENIPAFANAGFKNILTMPVQQPKGGGSSWWAYYQPLSFSIADNSALGTKEDLKELCKTAEEYNISIMVDVVANHMANVADTELETDGTPKVSPSVATYEPVLYANRNTDTDGNGVTFHHNPNATSSGSETQVYQYGKLPDLNTGNPYVQSRVLSLLKECIDVGVDGFRFDAAKHIETEDDPAYSSDFWINTLDVAKEYYHEKTNQDLYVYGEILNSPTDRSVNVYTKRMRVTADGYVSSWRSAVTNKNPGKIVSSAYTSFTAPEQIMTYIESHDNYIDASSHLSDSRVAKLWGVLASRKDLGVLYLGRPDSDITVGKIGNYSFESEYVAVVNRFHNRFVGANEYLTSNDATYVCERISDTDQGAVLVYCDAQPATSTVTVLVPNLENGNYYDSITGNKVVVHNNKAKVNFDKNGVCILTRSNAKLHPSYKVSERDGSFVNDKSITVTISNYDEAYYTYNSETEHHSLSDTTVISLKDHVLDDNTVTLNLHIKNGDFVVERSFKYSKVILIEGYFNVINLNPKYLTDFELYMWSWTPGVWSKNYTIQNGVLLVNTTGMTGFLLAIFEKEYVITNTSVWDTNAIKQSADIKGTTLQEGFFDASSF